MKTYEIRIREIGSCVLIVRAESMIKALEVVLNDKDQYINGDNKPLPISNVCISQAREEYRFVGDKERSLSMMPNIGITPTS